MASEHQRTGPGGLPALQKVRPTRRLHARFHRVRPSPDTELAGLPPGAAHRRVQRCAAPPCAITGRVTGGPGLSESHSPQKSGLPRGPTRPLNEWDSKSRVSQRFSVPHWGQWHAPGFHVHPRSFPGAHSAQFGGVGGYPQDLCILLSERGPGEAAPGRKSLGRATGRSTERNPAVRASFTPPAGAPTEGVHVRALKERMRETHPANERPNAQGKTAAKR